MYHFQLGSCSCHFFCGGLCDSLMICSAEYDFLRDIAPSCAFGMNQQLRIQLFLKLNIFTGVAMTSTVVKKGVPVEEGLLMCFADLEIKHQC